MSLKEANLQIHEVLLSKLVNYKVGDLSVRNPVSTGCFYGFSSNSAKLCEIHEANYCSNREVLYFDKEITKSKLFIWPCN